MRRCSSLYGDLLNNAINSGLRVGTPEVCSYLSYVNPNGNYFFIEILWPHYVNFNLLIFVFMMI